MKRNLNTNYFYLFLAIKTQIVIIELRVKKITSLFFIKYARHYSQLF